MPTRPGSSPATPTRRCILAGVVAIAEASLAAVSGLRFAAASEADAGIPMPPGACDAHVHVIGDPRQFPMSPERDYTPPQATATQLEAMLLRLKIERTVVVTPTVYGADNAATIAAIAQLGLRRARGVALVDETTSAATLDAMTTAGITGVRLFLYTGDPFDPKAAAARLRAKAELAATRGWHLEISTPPDVTAALQHELAAAAVPIVLDAFGWVAGGIDQPGFDAILSLVRSGRVYVKLSEPYRVSKQAPDYPDLAPVVRALAAANPDRLLWGSGWPHVDSSGSGNRAKTDIVPNLPIDTARLSRAFAAWLPDPEVRRKTLVDNPARLYRF